MTDTSLLAAAVDNGLGPDIVDSMWTEAIKAARQEELKRWARTIVRHELATKQGWLYDRLGDKYERVCEIERLNAEDARHRMDGKATDSWFVTLNLPVEKDIVTVWKDVEKYCVKHLSKGTLLGYYVVVEQRSEDVEHPKGWHIHMILRLDQEVSRSNARDRMKSIFDKIWTKVERQDKHYAKNWNVWLNLQSYHKKYIEGDKREEKMAKVAADVEIRKRYGFPEFLQGGQIIFPGEGIVSDGISQIHQTSSPSC